MNNVKFCKRCLYATTHPFGLVIDDEEICSGCRVHEEKDSLDWVNRWEKLQGIVKPYRTISGKNYDCIVPVSGGQDSYFIVDLVKNKLGLNPLLVSYNKYFNTKIGIENLANLKIQFNCDLIQQNINPITVKRITKSTLRRFGSIYWPILAGHTVFPVQTAIRYEIPLIIWGAHQGLEQVGMFSHLDEVEMTRRYRKEHDLMGFEAEDLITPFDTLTLDDVWQYKYPSDFDLDRVGVRGIYLGNFVRWDPKAQHEEMIQKYGYKTSRFPKTFDCYDYVDCFNYMDLHDLIKLYKHGYSKVTDHATREIRFGRISRNEGLRLVQHYQKESCDYVQQFSAWLGIKPKSLQFVLDQHKNPLFWNQTSPGTWSFEGLNDRQSKENLSEFLPALNFKSNSLISTKKDNHYITYGKGWPS
jgi:N-acetyl sugar amidotransferase